jgi:hypothetical protein
LSISWRKKTSLALEGCVDLILLWKSLPAVMGLVVGSSTAALKELQRDLLM